MSSGFESGRTSGEPLRRASDAKSSGQPDPALLEAVMQQTLAMSGGADDESARDLGALRSVVERHRGRPFALEPIAVELIGAILHERLNDWGLAPAARQAMTHQIAETIYDDPVTRGRFQALWTRLSEIPS